MGFWIVCHCCGEKKGEKTSGTRLCSSKGSYQSWKGKRRRERHMSVILRGKNENKVKPTRIVMQSKTSPKPMHSHDRDRAERCLIGSIHG